MAVLDCSMAGSQSPDTQQYHIRRPSGHDKGPGTTGSGPFLLGHHPEFLCQNKPWFPGSLFLKHPPGKPGLSLSSGKGTAGSGHAAD